jgi:hypothetical protein
VRRALLAALVLVAGALGVAAYIAHPAQERAFFAAGPRGTWVIAHRGGRGLRPENTLAAFEHRRSPRRDGRSHHGRPGAGGGAHARRAAKARRGLPLER